MLCFPWVGYEAKDGNQTTHQRTDDVEEAEGEIDKLVFHLLCVFIRFFNAFLLCIRQESCYDAEQWQEGTHLEEKAEAMINPDRKVKILERTNELSS